MTEASPLLRVYAARPVCALYAWVMCQSRQAQSTVGTPENAKHACYEPKFLVASSNDPTIAPLRTSHASVANIYHPHALSNVRWRTHLATSDG